MRVPLHGARLRLAGPWRLFHTDLMRYLLILSLLILTPISAQAENSQPAGTRINLSAMAERELPNNEVVITFRVEKEGKDARKIRQQVNQITAQIQKRLKKEPGLKMKTTSRNMQPIWRHPKNQPRIRTGWRMVQSEQITSSNLDAVPQWLDAIESEGAHLSSLQFRVSRKLSLQTRDALRLQAIKTFRSKAAVIAKGLDATDMQLRTEKLGQGVEKVVQIERPDWANRLRAVEIALKAKGFMDKDDGKSERPTKITIINKHSRKTGDTEESGVQVEVG